MDLNAKIECNDMDETLNKALDQMNLQSCRHVNPMINLMNDFHEQITHLMIYDAWHSGQEPNPMNQGFG